METIVKRPALIVHAVPHGSGGLTALCGEQIDGVRSTGRFPIHGAVDASPGEYACMACAEAVTR